MRSILLEWYLVMHRYAAPKLMGHCILQEVWWIGAQPIPIVFMIVLALLARRVAPRYALLVAK